MTSTAKQQPVLLIDGVCNLCVSSVKFVLKRDPKQQFRFASLQSPIAKTLLGATHQDAITRLDSVVLIDEKGVWHKSSAALRTLKKLSGLWWLLSIFMIIPKPIRDRAYDFIGSRRYRIFGRTEQCWIPDQNIRHRFLDAEPVDNTDKKTGIAD